MWIIVAAIAAAGLLLAGVAIVGVAAALYLLAPAARPVPVVEAPDPPKPIPRVPPRPPATKPVPLPLPPPTRSEPVEPPPTPPPADGQPLLVLDSGGHTAAVRGAFFTPDGSRLVTVSSDKSIRIGDVRTGDLLRVIRMPAGPDNEGALNAAALSPDGKSVAVAGMPFGMGKYGVMVYIVSLESGEVERVWRGHRDMIRALHWTTDGRYVISASADKTARVTEAATGKHVTTVDHGELVRAVAANVDGSRLVTVAEGSVRLWALPAGRKLADLPPHPDPFLSAAWSPDGATLAVGCRDGVVNLYGRDGAFRKAVPVPGEDKAQVYALAFAPDGKRVLYAGVDRIGRTGVLDLATGRSVPFAGHTNTVGCANFSPDGELAVTAGGDDHETLIWRTADARAERRFQGAGRAVFGVGWTPDGASLAFGKTNRGDTRLAAPPLEQLFRLDEFDVADAPAGRYLRIPTESGGFSLEAIDFFKIAVKRNGAKVGTYSTNIDGDRIYSFSLLPGGKAVFGATSGLYLVDLNTGKAERTFKGHNGLIFGISPSPDGRYFATGSSDQTVRVWRPDRAEPVLSLFVTGREWIAWTPEGYYAASAFGEQLMGWLVNRGPDATAEYHPAARFRRSLYRPDVVRGVLAAGGTAEALAKIGGGKPAVTVAQVLPPTVALLAPGPVRLNRAKQEVVAAAKSAGGRPVTAMRLMLDGRPWPGVGGVKTFAEPKAGEVRASWTVDLPAGKHTLSVQAESAVSRAVSAPVEVFVEGPEDRPDLYVVAVGISAYPGDLALQVAAKDAKALAAALKTRGKGVFGKVEVRVLTDADASKQGVTDALAWLGSRMTPKDVGVFSFSGHGTRDRKGRFYLVPADVDEDDPEGTCLPGDAVKTALGEMPGRLVALLDACHSGAAARPGKPARADDLARDLVAEDTGVVVMCSSLGSEYSLEAPELGHGFFTFGLLEALNGKADFDGDHMVHMHEADFYATRRVRQLSGGRQNPVTARPPGVRSFPLAGD